MKLEIYFGGFFHYDDVKDNHGSGNYGFITGENGLALCFLEDTLDFGRERNS